MGDAILNSLELLPFPLQRNSLHSPPVASYSFHGKVVSENHVMTYVWLQELWIGLHRPGVARGEYDSVMRLGNLDQSSLQACLQYDLYCLNTEQNFCDTQVKKAGKF